MIKLEIRCSPSLRKDISLIIILITSLILLLSWWFIFKACEGEKYQKSILLKSNSNRIKESILSDVRYTAYQMHYIANQINKNSTDPKYIKNLLETFHSDTKVNTAISWNMFSWVDVSGRLTIDGNEGILAHPKDLSQRDYIPFTRSEPNKLHLGKPVFGAVSNQWLIPAGIGVIKNNKYIGSIVFGFDISSLICKLGSLVKDEGVNFAIIGADGDIIAEPSNQYSDEDRKIILDLLKNNNNQAKEILISSQPIFNKNIDYIYYQDLDFDQFGSHTKIGIVTSYDKKISKQQLFNLWFPYLLKFLILTICAICLFFILHKKIIKPMVDLAKIKKLSQSERRQIAEKDYNYWFSGGSQFLRGAIFYLENNFYNKAAFELHQATENFYHCILLVFVGYKYKTHDIVELNKLCAKQNNQFLIIFPMASEEQRESFTLLATAYVEARYNQDYKITKEQLEYLIARIEKLKEIVKNICEEKISL